MQFSNHLPLSFLRYFCLIGVIFISWSPSIQGQNALEIIQVPKDMTFTDIKIELDEDARNAVQKKVNGLMRSPSFYQGFVDRCDVFFPIIEQVFVEEDLPLDFRFLSLQESALIADAVSRSNAVGFWQFKEATARELGLLVGDDIDERKNIVLSSRATAKYLKKNNYFMKNWVYTLLSYNLGLTGANNVSDRSKIGATKMELDGETHPYIIHLLAHKVAFEQIVGKNNSSDRIKLVEYSEAEGQTFSEIAKKSGVDPEQLEKYNRWISDEKVITRGRNIPFLIPIKVKDEKTLLAKLGVKEGGKEEGDEGTIATNGGSEGKDLGKDAKSKYPVIQGKREKRIGTQKVTVATANGLDAVIPDGKTDMPALIDLLDISSNRFMKYNDMDINSELIPNRVYYLKKKKSKTPTSAEFHVVQHGESMWDVAQMYAIKKKSLRKDNRMEEGEEPKPGRVLWLKKKRPRSTPIEMRDIGPKPKDSREEEGHFDWEVSEEKIKDILVKEDIDKKDDTPAPVITDDRFHVVKKGETLFEVSRQYKISTIRLAELNKLPEDMSIREGQILIVKEEVVENTGGVDIKDPFESSNNETIYIDENGNVVEKGEKPSSKEAGTAGGNQTPPIVGNAIVHIVRPQENLYSIARIYQVSHQDIMSWNKLQPLAVLKMGDKLYVSDPNGKPTTTTPADKPDMVMVKRDPKKHTVGQGETLYAIARNYEAKVGDIIAWNDLNAGNPISIGQVLVVEDPNAITEMEVVAKGGNDTGKKLAGARPTFHTVKAGDDLPNIAYKYGTSVNEVLRLNNMTEADVLFEGQTLLVKEVPTANTGTSVADKVVETTTTVTTTTGGGDEGVTPGSTPGTRAKTHTVKPGDTVYGLSRAYNIKAEELRSWNGMNDNTLSVGKEIIVGYETISVPKTSGAGASNTSGSTTTTVTTTTTPKTSDGPNVSKARSDNAGGYLGESTATTTKPVEETPVYHIVKKGDTLYSISRDNDISVNNLKILNVGLDPQSLAIGQKIRVK